MRPEQRTDPNPTATGGLTAAKAGGESRPAIPDHQLIRPIASGSYGEVWLARNVMGTCRAVKIVYRKNFDHERPFEREYDGIKKFEPVSRSHEGFVDVLQIGRDDAKGYFYYVMELGDDQATVQAFAPDQYQPKTLSSEVGTRGRLPVEECVRLALTLADALAHLHESGLTHRDIKPSNIIFVNGTPKLADIGLVADIGQGRSYVGTEGFIAPEGPGSPQADIYSLGKVLYEISTGKDRHEFPELPESFDDFPDAGAFREFNEVVIRACHADLDRRYPSARKMYAELAVLINGDSIRRLRLLERRLTAIKRTAMVGAMMLVAAGVVGYPLYRAFQMTKEKRERQIGASVTEGAKAMQDGHMTSALASFINALNLTQGLGLREEASQLRCSTTLTQCPRLVQMGFAESRVSSLDFSPNGRELLATLVTNKVVLMDLATGQFLPVVFAAERKPNMASFSPDGRFVATAGQELTLDGEASASIWDASTGAEWRTFHHPKSVYSVRFSADGKNLVTGCKDSIARVWDVQGRLLHQLKGHTDVVVMACFSPDQRWVATASHDGTACLWNVASGERLLPPLPHGSWVYYVAFSPDGKHLATSSFDRKVHVWNVATHKEIQPSMPHGDGVPLVEYSPDGSYILTASGEGIVRLWDAATQLPVARNSLLRNSDRTLGAAFNREGNRVATSSLDGTIRVWDFAANTPSPSPGGDFYSLDGTRSGWIGPTAIEIQDARTPGKTAVSREGYPALNNLQFSADGRWVLGISTGTASNSGSRVWARDIRTGSPAAPEIATPLSITNWFLSRDNVAVVHFHAGLAQIWDLPSGKPLTPVLSFTGSVQQAVFSGDGRQLLIAAGNELHTLDPKTGKALYPVMALENLIRFVVFSPQEKRFLTCLMDPGWNECWAQLWDAQTHRPIGKPLRHRDGVLHASFSPDGSKIATASEDFTARIWDTATGRPLTSPLRHDDQVHMVDFSPDGHWLLSVSTDQTARLWDVETGEPLTPAISNDRQLFHGRFDSDAYHILVGSSSTSNWRWEFPRDVHTIDDWQAIAYLLSGSAWSSLQDDQSAPKVRSQKLQATWRLMKSKYPLEFSTTAGDITAWHEHEANAAERSDQWAAAIFHLGYLRTNDLRDPALASRLMAARQKSAAPEE